MSRGGKGMGGEEGRGVGKVREGRGKGDSEF